MRLAFDIESDGLLLDITKIWCIVAIDIDTKEVYKFRPDEIREGVDFLMKADTLIGHNIVGFDLPAIDKLYKAEYTGTIVDTLLFGKLVYYDKNKKTWSHSLKAYGMRLKVYKDHYEDWTKFTEEMLEYCVQDVTVTIALYKHLIIKGRWLPRRALEIEQDTQKAITQQYLNGWRLDVKNLQDLHVEVAGEQEEALKSLCKVFKPLLIAKGNVVTPKKPYRRLGVRYVGPHQPIRLTEFNPGSGTHVVKWVETLYGKQSWSLTEKGNPKTDKETLEEMFKGRDWAKPLLHYLEVTKLLGQVATGPNAWLKKLRGDRIHHSVDILGTNTGRATHNNPNLAQVPSPKAYKGEESRSLFIPREGWKAVGCDLSGVQLRCLAHYLYPYDKGDYAAKNLEGDIHSENQKNAGLPTRGNAKTFIYAFLYGAGDEKLGEIVHGTSKDGKKLRVKFLNNMPALKLLIEDVKKAAKRRYLKSWTGRRIHVRSPHSALNALVQNLEVVVAKIWEIILTKEIKDRGIRCNQLGWIHDEFQFECHPDDVDKLAELLERTATEAGEFMELRCKIEAEAKIGDNWYDVH